jgi:branched-chain amino acid transport system permease protein
VLVFAALSIGGGGIVPAVLDRRRPRDAPRPAARPVAAVRPAAALRAEGVAKRFGELVALDGFAIDVEPGRVTALVGPNGSGKTTALRVLAGTIAPDAGRVSLGDADLTGLASVRTWRPEWCGPCRPAPSSPS